MPPEKLRLFAAATFVIAGTPGPNMLLVMTSGLRHGVRRSTATMAGCLTAVVAMMTVSAAGIGALLEASPSAFRALKLGGALYLAYLGISMWRGGGATAEKKPEQLGGSSPAALYRQGLLVALSNPKALLFAAAFLPQFLEPSRPRLPQLAILLAVFAVIETSWYFAYSTGGKTAAAWLRRPAVRAGFDRFAGTLFVGFAAALALGR